MRKSISESEKFVLFKKKRVKKGGLFIPTDIIGNPYIIFFTLKIILLQNNKLIIQYYVMSQTHSRQSNRSVYHSKWNRYKKVTLSNILGQ